MARMFPQLGKRTVEIKDGNGKVHTCPMLSMAQYEEVTAITERVEAQVRKLTKKESGTKQMQDGFRDIYAIIEQHVPAELKGDLYRIGYLGIVDLALYLALGYDKDDQDKADGGAASPEA